MPEGGLKGKVSEEDCVAATFVFGAGEQTQQEWGQGITDLHWWHVILGSRQSAKTRLRVFHF